LTGHDEQLTLGDMSLIRGTALQGFVELVDELGGDPGELLRGVRLPPSSVGDPDTFVPYRSVVAVLESAARATGAADFGRRLGARQGTEILGPLGVAARTAPDVGTALAAIEKYMVVYSPAIAVGVRWSAGDELATFDWRLLDRRPPAHPQSAELALAVSCRVFRLLAGDDFRPTSVQLRHRPLADEASYEDFFGCSVQHSAPRDGFRFPVAVLTRPMETDGAVHALVADYLASVVSTAATGTSDAVALLVRRMLPTGAADLGLVAEQLAQHPRTLQRRLSEEGTSFAALVDQVRRDEAERYLRDTDMPLAQLSGVLGLSEQSALTRACRRWFGSPPSQVRRGLRGG
jgi:AraC-like DNA-binding protein